MAKKTDYSKRSFMIIGTHGDEDLERATMTFACAGASSALGVNTTIFLTMGGVRLAQKGVVEKLQPVKGMATVKDLRDAFLESGGRIRVCIPCLESRGIQKSAFIDGVEFVNLMDFAANATSADRVFTC